MRLVKDIDLGCCAKVKTNGMKEIQKEKSATVVSFVNSEIIFGRMKLFSQLDC